jgi:hypothetical protein
VAQTQLSTQNSLIREHILITNHSRLLLDTIRLKIMTAPTSGVRGMGVETGAGLSGTRTGPDFIGKQT